MSSSGVDLAAYVRIVDLSNPETSAAGAVDAIVASALAAYQPPNTVLQIFIGSDLSVARPTWSGSVTWLTTATTGIPVHAVSGDVVRRVTVETLPWTPLSLPNLLLMVDAKLSGGTDGVAVNPIPDLGPSGLSLTQATSANRALYSAAGLGTGYPAYTFDGVNDNASVALPADYTGALTIYAVAKSNPATLTGGSDFLFDFASSAAAPLKGALGRNTSNDWIVTRGPTLTSSAVANNSVHRHKLVINGASSSLTVDGTVVASGSLTMTAFDVATFVLGSRADNANFLDGEIGHLSIVEGLVLPGDDASMTTWLTSNWPVT